MSKHPTSSTPQSITLPQQHKDKSSPYTFHDYYKTLLELLEIQIRRIYSQLIYLVEVLCSHVFICLKTSHHRLLKLSRLFHRKQLKIWLERQNLKECPRVQLYYCIMLGKSYGMHTKIHMEERNISSKVNSCMFLDFGPF